MKRLSRIEIYNFKNIKRAELDFKNSILGLYGQNGSGKTALIDVLDLIKTILCGQKISSDFSNMIHVDADYSRIVVQFTIDENGRLNIRLNSIDLVFMMRFFLMRIRMVKQELQSLN